MGFRLSQDEIDGETVFVHSHVYPQADGTFTWHVTHDDDWEASGVGSSHPDCVRQVNAVVAAEIERSGFGVGDGATLMREFHGKPPNEELTGLSVLYEPRAGG